MLATAGCEAQVTRLKGPRSIRGLQVTGKADRVNNREPLMMPRDRKPPQMGCCSGVKDWPLRSGRR